MTNKLVNKVKILRTQRVLNELGELTDNEYTLYKTIYVQILPQTTNSQDLNSESEQSIYNYKLICRKNSYKDINYNDLISFDDKNFKIDKFQKDFKNNEFLEIFVSYIVQH